MKKIALITLLLTIVNPVFAETYQMKVKISNILENSVFESGIPSTPELERTGPNGTISLIGTNGLTASSFSASSVVASSYPVAALFDGHIEDNNNIPYSINDSAGAYYGTYSAWSAAQYAISGVTISINFEDVVDIQGLRLYGRINGSSRSVKDFTLQKSTDGSVWSDVQTFTSITRGGQNLLNSGIKTQHMRLLIISNYGDSNYLQLDEIEIF
jgi:hypothetical protein